MNEFVFRDAKVTCMVRADALQGPDDAPPESPEFDRDFLDQEDGQRICDFCGFNEDSCECIISSWDIY